MPAEPNSRERLRQLLRSGAIVRSDRRQSIVDHSGRSMPWIFYSWGITLTHEGASLAADCMVDALKRFDSVQIAGVGMTGLPLVSSIVSSGLGRFAGLYIRDGREKWGTRRQVEGSGNRDLPVVVVDDCVCSGSSLKRAFTALEDDGYKVEGALCLVNFPWNGGTEWAQALGYRIETLFDIWTDLEMQETQEIPGYRKVQASFDPDHQVPEGLSPADAARRAAVHFLNYGLLPTPPKSFDRNYGGSGGIVVSFRDRRTDYRVARDGFYHLDSSDADSVRDVLLATAKTLLSSRGAVAQYGLDRLKVGVTLFGEQTPTVHCALDFHRFGVLIQSKVRPWKIASALPNTQFFVSEIEHLHHARFTNARLLPHEPFAMYRSTVSKSVESGCSWPAFGTSVSDGHSNHSRIGEQLVARAREVFAAVLEGRDPRGNALTQAVFPEKVDGIAVTLYSRGMIGCWTSFQSDPEAMVREATFGAWNDKRWRRKDDISLFEIDIVVSVFQLAEVLGFVTKEYAAFNVRLGRDSLGVCLDKDGKTSLLLAYIPCLNSWSKKEMVEGLLRKAGLSGLSFYWTTYATRSWVGQSSRVAELDSGYPKRTSEEAFPFRATAHLLARYIADKFGKNGLPDYCYYPVFNRSVAVESAPRVILALNALLNAAMFLEDSLLHQMAISGLRVCCEHIRDSHDSVQLNLPETPCGAAAEVFLINAIYASGERSLIEMPAVRSLVSKLRTYFHSDGAITWQREGMRVQSDHDLFPGMALRMAAMIAQVDSPDKLPPFLDRHLTWNRRRFDLLHPWGMIFWQTQGWAALYKVTADPSMASFVFELADWALERQLEKNGAFLVDYARDGPGFHTACVLEALADAWSVARQVGDIERERNYRRTWERGIKFVDRLIIREDDRFAMPKPSRALGGVRESLTSSRVRIDYVAHTLLALMKSLSLGLTV
jgi:orotate phosphoribosyltransferase/AMMECR1 domain-containing protein